ncbi:cobalamin B12-binding domain-containing protein [bacterium]|nr:cobalamin B12-binding domain-containing protein [bacterium]
MAQALAGVATRLEEALLSLDRAGVAALFSELSGRGPLDRVLLADAVVAPALLNIGNAWERGTVALSQVYMAGRLVEEALDHYLPPAPPRPGAPRIGVGVLEDHHALGKRIVCAVLVSAGYDVRDLGAGCSPEALVDGALEHGVDILMVSVLMLNRALRVARVRELLDQRVASGITLVPRHRKTADIIMT